LVEFLCPGKQPVLINEGEEPEPFWDALGGKQEYKLQKTLVPASREARLFQLLDNSGGITVAELRNFSQDDLF
jgi:hypothetical protein